LRLYSHLKDFLEFSKKVEIRFRKFCFVSSFFKTKKTFGMSKQQVLTSNDQYNHFVVVDYIGASFSNGKINFSDSIN